jgi:hypothetical protein
MDKNYTVAEIERLKSEYIAGTIDQEDIEPLRNALVLDPELQAELEEERHLFSQFSKEEFKHQAEVASRNISVRVLQTITDKTPLRLIDKSRGAAGWTGLAIGLLALVWISSEFLFVGSELPNVITRDSVAKSIRQSSASIQNPVDGNGDIPHDVKVSIHNSDGDRPDKRRLSVASDSPEKSAKPVKQVNNLQAYINAKKSLEVDQLASASFDYESDILTDEDVTFLLIGDIDAIYQ